MKQFIDVRYIYDLSKCYKFQWIMEKEAKKWRNRDKLIKKKNMNFQLDRAIFNRISNYINENQPETGHTHLLFRDHPPRSGRVLKSLLDILNKTMPNNVYLMNSVRHLIFFDCIETDYFDCIWLIVLFRTFHWRVKWVVFLCVCMRVVPMGISLLFYFLCGLVSKLLGNWSYLDNLLTSTNDPYKKMVF